MELFHKGLVSAVLEAGPQLQWRIWWTEPGPWNNNEGGLGHELSQDQILGEDQCADLQRTVYVGW